MIGAVLTSPLVWGVVASGATDLLTRLALKKLPIQESVSIRGITVSFINIAILAKTCSYSGSLPGLIYGIALQISGIKEKFVVLMSLKKTLNSLKAEETDIKNSIKKGEDELNKNHKEIDETEKELKRQQDLIIAVKDAIDQLENEKKTT